MLSATSPRPVPRPARRPSRAAAVALVLACGLGVTGCSGDDDQQPTGGASQAPGPDEAEELGPAIPADWLDHWCEARQEATLDDAVALMGEPPTDDDATQAGRIVTWRDENLYVGLSLRLDADGNVKDASSSINAGLSESTQDALTCQS